MAVGGARQGGKDVVRAVVVLSPSSNLISPRLPFLIACWFSQQIRKKINLKR